MESLRYLNIITLRVGNGAFVITVPCGSWFAQYSKSFIPESFCESIRFFFAS